MTTALQRILVTLLVAGVALFAALAGCGGGTCFRNSDCNSGYGCRSGSCLLLVVPDAGDAGDANADTAATSDAAAEAGDAASQIADGG